jgi:competence ComEA-like helix-hairpin-helix protein
MWKRSILVGVILAAFGPLQPVFADPPKRKVADCPSNTKKAIAFTPEKVDINTASFDQLVQIPGVGIKTARAIISHREANRGFRSMKQLSLVSGVGKKTFACLNEYVFISPPKPARSSSGG